MDLLACVECGSDILGVVYSGQQVVGIICQNCRRWYPVIDGIPRMLPDNFRIYIEDVEHYKAYEMSFEESWADPTSIRYQSTSGGQNNPVGTFFDQRKIFGVQGDWEEVYERPLSYYATNTDEGGKRQNILSALAAEPHCYYGNQIKRDDVIKQTAAKGALNVLDLGCGDGRYRDLFVESGNRFIGLDISIDHRPEIQGVGYSLPFRDEVFDYIICDGVLEHVYDPFRVVGEVYRVLKKGGEGYFYVPFFYKNHGAPYDFYRYTKSGFHYLLKDFVRIEIYAFGGFFSALSHFLRAPTSLLYRFSPGLGNLCRVMLSLLFGLLIPLDRHDRLRIITRGYYAFVKK